MRLLGSAKGRRPDLRVGRRPAPLTRFAGYVGSVNRASPPGTGETDPTGPFRRRRGDRLKAHRDRHALPRSGRRPGRRRLPASRGRGRRPTWPASVRRSRPARRAASRGAQAGQRRHEDQLIVLFRGERQRADFVRCTDGVQAVAKPLDGRPRDKNTPFDGILRRPIRERGGECGDQPPASRARTGRPVCAKETHRCHTCTWPYPPSRQPWPTSDACWSPATPRIGRPSGR